MNESDELDIVSDQFLEVVGKDPNDFVNDAMTTSEKIEVLSKQINDMV